MKPFDRMRVGFLMLLGLSLVSWASPVPAGQPKPGQRTEALGGGTRDLFRKQPYLVMPGNPTQMRLLWQLSASDTSVVEWGSDTTYALGRAVTSEYGTDHQHSLVIGSLTQGARYLYRVTAAGATRWGSFTAALPADSANLKFFAYGDTRTDGATHNAVAGAIVSAYTADPSFQTFVLSSGDLASSGTSESAWDSEFFNPTYTGIRAMMADLPYLACMGNHEDTGALFVKYYPYPFTGGRYYSFDVGPAHFVVVDQYTSYTSGSPQLQWITNDLATTTKPWKFMLLHEPGWSAGGTHPNNATVQTYLQPLCVQYGVAIVFGGHNHYYSRAVVNGIQHITTGGGGAPLYTPIPTYAYVVASARAYNFCEIEITGFSLAFRALKTDGTVIDSFTLTLTDPASVTSRPAAPDLGPASPNPFSAETHIAWSAPDGQRSRLLITDVCGRKIRSFPASGAGPQSARWNGRDEQGQPVGSGIYFYRLDRPLSTSGVGKVLLIR